MRTTSTGEQSWSGIVRLLAFLLSATSIGALLGEFYFAGTMRSTTLYTLLPASVLLLSLATADAVRGSGKHFRFIMIGLLSGFIAAVAYDIFRLPFVFAKQWGLTSFIPAMPLFKVFPAFGAMILGMPALMPSYPLEAHLLGWLYHFSNGMTFGCMYVAIVGNPMKHHWAWAVLFALGLEAAMLLTPYTTLFQIHPGRNFLLVTITAHLIFGVVMGISVRRLTLTWLRPQAPA